MNANKNGDGCGADPLVVLPGLLCDSRMFQSQIRTFGAKVIDGFYGRANRVEAMADFALEQMPGRCVLLGHSMGARVALEVWRKAPERVSRLVLCDTGVHPVRDGEARQRYALRDVGRAGGSEALVDAWLPPMIGPARRDDPALLSLLRPMCIDAGTSVYEVQIEALLSRPDAQAVLPTVDCPAIAIVGREDQWSPVAQHEAIVAMIRGAELRVVEGAGHMSPVEQPEAFNQILGAWLVARHPGAQGNFSNRNSKTERHI